MTNQTVLDFQKSADARDLGIDRAIAKVSAAWKASAEQWVMYVANTKPEFTTDDVWAAGLEKPEEARALGEVMRAMVLRNIIENVGYRKSAQVSRHRAPVAIWRKK